MKRRIDRFLSFLPGGFTQRLPTRLSTHLSGGLLAGLLFIFFWSPNSQAVFVNDIGIAEHHSTTNQDRYQIVYHPEAEPSQLSYFAVFDGHGPRASADAVNYAANHLIPKLSSKYAPNINLSDWLKLGFLETDRDICQFTDVGTTATLAVFEPKTSTLSVANVGDSPAVLYTQKSLSSKLAFKKCTVQLSTDHLATDPAEKSRIKNLGGKIVNDRVGEKLEITRSLGDTFQKWGKGDESLSHSKELVVPIEDMNLGNFLISPIPSVNQKKLKKSKLQFLILASDGVIDSHGNHHALTPQEATEIAKVLFRAHKTANEVARSLVEHVSAQGSKDDRVAIVIRFDETPYPREISPVSYPEKLDRGQFFKETNYSYSDFIKNPSR